MACGIRNSGLWNTEYQSRNPKSYLRLESRIYKFHGQIVESIRNPRPVIQNPRLSWISLHRVTVRHVGSIPSSSPYIHFLVSGNVGDHGSVEMNATEEEIEIRVIKEDKDVRRSLEAPSTTEVQLE